MTLRGVLFDATGTLIELREPVGDTYARVARAFDVELSAWRLGDAFGRIFRSAPPMAFPNEPPERIPELERDWWYKVVRGTLRAADSSVRFGEFARFFETLYSAYATAERWRATPGSREVLKLLRTRGLATGVVSNFDRRLTKILKELDFSGLLDSITLPADAGVLKPDARIFEIALERLGLAPNEVAFVGDDAERDLAGAREVGMLAIDAASMATLEDLPGRLPRS